jgi:hypothetical protein
MSQPPILDGRVAVITGAGNGIGRQHALLFASEGAKVVVNVGILRDAFLHRMTEDEWDLVLRVHLKGHFCTLRHATDHWRTRSKAGEPVKGAVINTTSASGTYLANPGQANYGAAKAAIAARTRLTEDVPGMVGELMKKPDSPDAFDTFDPAHVSPLVAFLAREDCAVTGRLFAVQGGAISELRGWQAGDTFSTVGPWTQEILERQLGGAGVAA